MIPSQFFKIFNSSLIFNVSGNSMYPKYEEGDIIFISNKHDCKSGKDAVVYVNDCDATLRTVFKNKDGTITLKPRNPCYAEKTFEPHEVFIIGVVVRMIRNG